MAEDARFEDGGARPLKLKALDAEDLQVLSALVQDAIFPGDEVKWSPAKRRFALLLNRFRWEDQKTSQPERVQAVMLVEDVLGVKSQGVAKGDKDTIHSVLSVSFEAGEDGAGRVLFTLAGDGAIACDVEALEVVLQDVTRPYIAPSKKRPSHPE